MPQKRSAYNNKLLLSAQAFVCKQLESPAYVAAIKGAPISKADFELLTEDRLWLPYEIRRAVSTLQSLAHVTEGHTGVANTRLPLEYIAWMIFVFVSPANWLAACSVCGDMGMRSLAEYEEAAGVPDGDTTVDGQMLLTYLFRCAAADAGGDEDFQALVSSLLSQVGRPDKAPVKA